MSIIELKEMSRTVRSDIVTMVHKAGSGHPGGSLSAADLMVGLYFGGIMRVNPANPDWEGRDRFILSKGHVAPVIYSVLARKGFFPVDELWTLRKLGSILQGHPHKQSTPGLDCSSGSLGQGLSISNGMAIGFKMQGMDNRDNVCAIVDYNRVQLDGDLSEIKDLGDLAAKWHSFGWNVIELDGHDMEQVLRAFEMAKAFKGKPSVLIANTVKGKGVSFMENDCNWHGNAPSAEQLENALKEINREVSM